MVLNIGLILNVLITTRHAGHIMNEQVSLNPNYFMSPKYVVHLLHQLC